MNWLSILKHNPINALTESNNIAVRYFTKRDLLNTQVQSPECIWALPEVNKITKKQMKDGSWSSKKKNLQTVQNYRLIETWKQLRFLVEKYEMNKTRQCIQNASEYILSCQTNEGDIRGFLGNQYAMYYTGAVIALLLKAGYENDPRIKKGLAWLLAMRQNDGGWVPSPIILLPWAQQIEMTSTNRETLTAWDKNKPLCLNATGMVIRAFALHTAYRRTEIVRKAAQLLKQRFFMENNYTSYKHKDHWLFFQFPYWWNNLVSALDSISLIDTDKNDADINKAVSWLIDHQQDNGLWKMSYSRIHKNTRTAKTEEARMWITLAICRILKRLFGS